VAYCWGLQRSLPLKRLMDIQASLCSSNHPPTPDSTIFVAATCIMRYKANPNKLAVRLTNQLLLLDFQPPAGPSREEVDDDVHLVDVAGQPKQAQLGTHPAVDYPGQVHDGPAHLVRRQIQRLPHDQTK
jgi:hypothetical protein